MKAASIALLAALALVATGCDEVAPRPQTADQAIKTYQGRLAETCPDKHKENLSPDELNHAAREFYHDMDINAQQRIDKFVAHSCSAAGAGQPGCYNDAFLSAVQNDGDMDHFALTVCAEGGEAQPGGNAHEGSGL